MSDKRIPSTFVLRPSDGEVEVRQNQKVYGDDLVRVWSIIFRDEHTVIEIELDDHIMEHFAQAYRQTEVHSEHERLKDRIEELTVDNDLLVAKLGRIQAALED